jgi:hypothetical protein
MMGLRCAGRAVSGEVAEGGAASLCPEAFPFIDASVRRDLEVFNPDHRASTMYMGGSGEARQG